jgi:adenylosuccinate lyase
MAKTPNTLPFSELTAISPLDGRYRKSIAPLANYLSEYSLIKTRLAIEIQYLQLLSQENIIRTFSAEETDMILHIDDTFTIDEAEKIKALEEVTNHDVKAVELYLRDRLKETSLSDVLEMLHFGITSEDINNIAYRLMLKRATDQVMLPALREIRHHLISIVREYKKLPMLARTHGQPAVPTTLGKEVAVFASRLHKEMTQLEQSVITGKFSGAVGNYNALSFAYPAVDWLAFSEKFLASFGLSRSSLTTQINTYEDITAYLHVYQRINSILLDLTQDMWRYISDGWFKQEVKKDEVGSSTMPQKVNPIFFEGSEGNLGLANTFIDQFARKLPVSRLQRDLSDSTVIRNTSMILGYSLLSYRYLQKGMLRVKPHTAQITADLDKDWSILTEAAQTVLRQENVPDAYNFVKSLSRGEHITATQWGKWVTTLPISEEAKTKLHALTPATYIGLAEELTDSVLEELDQVRHI